MNIDDLRQFGWKPRVKAKTWQYLIAGMAMVMVIWLGIMSAYAFGWWFEFLFLTIN